MRKLVGLPQTITGQITLLIGLSLLLASAFSIGAAYFLLASNTGRASPAASIRAATIAQLVGAAESLQKKEEIVDLAARIGVPIEYSLKTERPAGQSDSGRQAFLQRKALARFLAFTGLDPIKDHIVLGPDHTISMELTDRSSLVIPIPYGGGFGVPRIIVAPIIYILIAIAIVLIGLFLYAARFVTAPLSSFAEAADAVGRTTDRRAKIAETGPREIAQVARALNEMHARISALLDERTGMLTAISHDLRTPLTRIRLRAERISQVCSIGAAGEGMLTDVSRMEQMLAETLMYMRDHDRGEPVLAVDLPSVLETVCVELSDLGQAVTYIGTDKLVYQCQPRTLTRAVTNLVDNGLKYGTKVLVELGQLRCGAIQIDICDDGPGIPYPLREKVFEPFFKTASQRTVNGKEGFGLGLSIARNVIKAHGGTIELLAAAPHGTRVRITLPSVPAPRAAEISSAAKRRKNAISVA